MRFLLDTHSLIWALDDPGVLGEQTRAALADSQNEVFVSTASIWEAAIKAQTGKLTLPANFLSAIRGSGFHFLGISEDHAIKAADLPMYHKDPFDRMLVAQAIMEGLTLVTRGANIPAYQVPILRP